MSPKSITVKIRQGEAWWCQFACLLSIAASNESTKTYLTTTAKLNLDASLTDDRNTDFRRWLAKVLNLSDLPKTPGGSYRAIDGYFDKLLKRLQRETLKPNEKCYVSFTNRISLQLEELPMLLRRGSTYVMFKFKTVCDDTSFAKRHFCVYSGVNRYWDPNGSDRDFLVLTDRNLPQNKKRSWLAWSGNPEFYLVGYYKLW